jgi:hypothetical protein
MARRLGVTQDWLRTESESGNVPCLRAGNRYLYNPAAVQETLAVEAAKQNAGRNPQGVTDDK